LRFVTPNVGAVKETVRSGERPGTGIEMKRIQKLRMLEKIIRSLGPMAVAFSGGVDSAFLAAVAGRIWGSRTLLITVVSPIHPRSEIRSARVVARELGLPLVVMRLDALRIPGFALNPPNRCYLCKKAVFSKIIALARRRGFETVADGTNADDASDYRPGKKAADELGIASPLQQAGLGKEDIRALSRAMKLPTADKPSMACLASRFPYGGMITRKALRALDDAEEALRRLGFSQVRVRFHGEVARVEIPQQEMDRMVSPGIRRRASAALRKAGFSYASLDLDGYRTGSMNALIRRSRLVRRSCVAPGRQRKG